METVLGESEATLLNQLNANFSSGKVSAQPLTKAVRNAHMVGSELLGVSLHPTRAQQSQRPLNRNGQSWAQGSLWSWPAQKWAGCPAMEKKPFPPRGPTRSTAGNVHLPQTNEYLGRGSVMRRSTHTRSRCPVLH